MKRLLLILAIVLLPNAAHAAVAFGSISTANTASSYTSDAVSGSNTVGIVYVAGESASDQITAVTWNGVSMTKIAAVQVPGDRFISAWCVNNPASATTIAFTGGTFWRSFNSYYTGAKCPVDSSNTGSISTNTALSVSTTVVDANAWVISFQKDNAGGKTYSASNAITTMRANADAGGISVADSNGVTGSGSKTATQTASGNANHAMIAFSLAPAATAATFNPWQFWAF